MITKEFARQLAVEVDDAVIQGAYGTWRASYKGSELNGYPAIVWILFVDAEDTLEQTHFQIVSVFRKQLVFQFFTKQEQHLPKSTLSLPVSWSGDLGSNSLNDDVATYLESVESVIQIFEDPDRIPELRELGVEPKDVKWNTPKPEQVPLDKVFKQAKKGDEPKTTPAKQVDWRSSTDPNEIAKAFPAHPTTDDIQDLYSKAKELRSNMLMNLVRKKSAELESISTSATKLVNEAIARFRSS